jgi:electron transport complex protein RnfD
LHLQRTVEEIATLSIFGKIGGKGNEIVAAAYMLGGLYLLQQRIISWRMPFAYLLAVFLTASALFGYDSSRYASPWFHLFTGGVMLGAFFIVTDPVSGATTPKGKLIFASGAGFLAYMIRVFGGYPDGVAFGILLMNMAVPLIDAYTQPPVFGYKKSIAQKSDESSAG